MIETYYIYEFRKIFDEVCEVACVKFDGFRRFIGDFKVERKFFFCINTEQYLTIISHHAKEDSRKALMKAADL